MRLAVFASGTGTNFQAIVDAASSGALPADVVLLISNVPGAGAPERARRHDIPTVHVDPDDENHPGHLLDLLSTHDVTFVALAGYLRKIPPNVVEAFRHRMLNIHPALLPAFGGKGMYGMRVHEAVLDYGAKWTGVTVHLVDEGYDTGPVVLQQPVPVQPQDTPETLAERVQTVEHRLYPEALRLFAEGRVHVEDRRVFIDSDPRLSSDPPAEKGNASASSPSR